MTDDKNTGPEFSELSLFEVSPALSSFLPEDFCTSNHIALLDDPSEDNTQRVRVGVLDTKDQGLLDEVQEMIGKTIEPVQLNAYEIYKACLLYTSPSPRD